MKDELGGNIMRPKTYGYLTDCKDCLEATQLENIVNQIEKNKTDVISFPENDKEFIN